MDIMKSVSAAGISAVITVSGIHPIDVVKTRLQISGKDTRDYKSLGIIGSIKTITKEEGIHAFWKGVSAAWLREVSYTSLRLGLYSPIKKLMGIDDKSHFIMKFSAGSAAGVLGSLVGNPFDVIKTRMITFEGNKSLSFSSIIKEIYTSEKALGFYKGLQANLMRSCVLNGTKMACYDEIKQWIVKSNLVPSGIPTQFCAAFGAGFFMASAVAPFDMIRTKLMNQSAHNKMYNGFIDCLVKISKEGGILGLYAGFIPIWSRFAPTTCLQLVIFEQIKPILGVEKMSE